ncbi:hypothetical protein [Micromonospora inositola]|uniref:hypothetical protein n=1 Tax=Micromonospora inositola TaxID=47865 RepID=UPI0012FDE540|nr:hypothetical protein [Micromonospora inositola]
MTAIGLRPATAADSTMCYLLHRAAMRTYIEAIWGWDEQTQQPLPPTQLHTGQNQDRDR